MDPVFSFWNFIKKSLVKIGQIQASIFMGVVYYLIIGPTALLYQLFQTNKKTKETYWVKREHIEDFGLYLKRQF